MVGGRAEGPAFGVEGLNAVFTIVKFANLFCAAIDVVTVDGFILYDRARGSVLTVVTILAIGTIFTIGAILAVFAVLEFTDLDVAAEDVVAVVGQVLFDAAGSSVLTVVAILTIIAVFTIGAVLAVSTLFAVAEFADLEFATVDIETIDVVVSFDAARSSVLTIVTILTILTIFTVLAVSALFAIANFADLFFTAVDIVAIDVIVGFDAARSTILTINAVVAILAISTIFSVGSVLAVFAVVKFANLFGAAVNFVSVNLVVLYDRARGSVFTILAIDAILSVFTVDTIFTIGAVLTIGAILEFANLYVATVNVKAIDFKIFGYIARDAVLTILAIVTIFTIGTVLTVCTVFAVGAIAERANLFVATVDIVTIAFGVFNSVARGSIFTVFAIVAVFTIGSILSVSAVLAVGAVLSVAEFAGLFTTAVNVVTVVFCVDLDRAGGSILTILSVGTVFAIGSVLAVVTIFTIGAIFAVCTVFTVVQFANFFVAAVNVKTVNFCIFGDIAGGSVLAIFTVYAVLTIGAVFTIIALISFFTLFAIFSVDAVETVLAVFSVLDNADRVTAANNLKPA